jgi:hypothetical protein
MEYYDLTIFRAGTAAPMFPSYPLATSPFGSFAAGDVFDLRPSGGGLWKIDRVGHSIVPITSPPGRLHKTLLVISPEPGGHP